MLINVERLRIGSVIRNFYRPVRIFGDTQRRKRVINAKLEIVNQIPDPQNWKQEIGSYFGFSVGSGIFDGAQSTRILYVGGAPHTKQEFGEVYIFDYVLSRFKETNINIKKIQTFHGQQFGEFFGYAILSEDVNGDGWTDLIVSAPLYADGILYEKGAVYVFINKGNFQFESQLIVSPSDEPARFGTTISKLGDINNDGFNDLAIGAPFDGDGLVYIYLGNPNGLNTKYSQILKAPLLKSFDQQHMFGHGLSRGVDIDSNGYNDLAVGAPNAEAVYLYKAYPVVKIIASISSVSREIKKDQTKFQIRACYKIESVLQRSYSADLVIKIKLDPQVRRVSFESGSNEMEINVIGSDKNICNLYNVNVKFSLKDIFKPIELEMNSDLVHKVPDSEGINK